MAAGAQLEVAELLDRAIRATGLSDFGDPWFLQPLRDVVAMINAEAGLLSRDEPRLSTPIAHAVNSAATMP